MKRPTILVTAGTLLMILCFVEAAHNEDDPYPKQIVDEFNYTSREEAEKWNDDNDLKTVCKNLADKKHCEDPTATLGFVRYYHVGNTIVTTTHHAVKTYCCDCNNRKNFWIRKFDSDHYAIMYLDESIAANEEVFVGHSLFKYPAPVGQYHSLIEL